MGAGLSEAAWTPLQIVPQSLAFTVLLGVFAALPAVSIDVSAPTLAIIPQALGTSTTVASLTLSLFMVGFAIGQLGGGRLSDRVGRRPVLLAGLTSYTLASIACASSASGSALVAARFAQGIGAGACSVLSFAMVQDLFEGEAARAKRSYVTVVFGIVPMLAPAIGSFLAHIGGWRAIHAVLAAAGGLLMVIATIGLQESRRASTAESASSGPTQRRRLTDDPGFLAIAAANALSYAAIFAYIAGSPIVMIAVMGLSSAAFAAVFACTAAALTAGAWTNGRLGRHGVGSTAVLGPALAVAGGAASALALAGLAGLTSGLILLPLLLLTMFARGMVAPNLQHLAIERQADQAGAASAAVGVSQLLCGAIASAAVGLCLPDHGVSAVAVPMAALAVGALVLWSRTSR